MFMTCFVKELLGTSLLNLVTGGGCGKSFEGEKERYKAWNLMQTFGMIYMYCIV